MLNAILMGTDILITIHEDIYLFPGIFMYVFISAVNNDLMFTQMQ